MAAIEHSPTQPATYSLGKMNNGVGGTIVYSAWLRRYVPGDFRVRTDIIARYGEDALPPRSAVVDWPIGYDDLEPYYTQVEQITGVAGIPGNIRGEPVEGGNPFEGYRSAEYPLPPLRTAGLSELFADAARRLRISPISRSRGHQLRPVRRPSRLHLLWLTTPSSAATSTPSRPST